MIAMALANEPELLIADSRAALDVTVQLKILDLLKDLQARLGMSFFVTDQSRFEPGSTNCSQSMCHAARLHRQATGALLFPCGPFLPLAGTALC